MWELLGLNGGYFLPIHLAAALSGRGKRLRPKGEGESLPASGFPLVTGIGETRALMQRQAQLVVATIGGVGGYR